MAKVTGPLHSMAAHGSIGQAINFQTRGKNSIARSHKRPAQPQSALTNLRRETFKQAALDWASMSILDKQQYDLSAKALHLTGWNLFVRDRMAGIPSGAVTTWDLGATIWDLGGTVWIG